MTLSLTVLGCDGGYAGSGGAGSGYVVESGDTAIWLDAGPGTLGRLQLGLSFEQLGAVIVTHEHPDHVADLDGLAVALHFAAEPRRVPVYAPPSVRRHCYFESWDELDWQDVADGDRVVVGDCDLTFSRTDHGPETLAVRVDADGVCFGYSADSGPAWSLEALGTGLDVALCEATWTRSGERKAAQHMSSRQAGVSARDARVAELVITHRWPTIPAGVVAEEAGEAFGAPVRQASSGTRFEFERKSEEGLSEDEWSRRHAR